MSNLVVHRPLFLMNSQLCRDFVNFDQFLTKAY